LNCLICLKTLPETATSSYHGYCLERMFGTRKPSLELAESRRDLVTSMPKKTHGFSISGVQMKAQLKIEKGELNLVDHGGQFIMKPSPEEYPNVAENEHATLVLMRKVGFPVPPCGLLKLKDEHLVFVIRRYDRDFETGEKIHQEDAMQALGIANSDSSRKYTAASYQKVIELVVEHGGAAVAAELLERIAFSYLVGNDDHHLKNVSFLFDPVFKLTPCYDVLASGLYGASSVESPLALPMLDEGEPKYYRTMGNGFYAGSDFLELGTKAGLPEKAVKKRLHALTNRVRKEANVIINASYMPEGMKANYLDLVTQRLSFMDVM